jgi:hypothetical protein
MKDLIAFGSKPIETPFRSLAASTALALERIPVTWKRSLHVGSNWRTLAD